MRARSRTLSPLRDAILTIGLGLGLGLVAACASESAVERTYDRCSPLTIALAPGASVAEVSGVEGAILAWSEVLPTQLAIGTGAQSHDVLPLHFESGVSYRAMYWDSLGVISVSRDLLDPADYPVAIAHELGHAFGLLHVDTSERPSVMNVGNLTRGPTADDAAAVRALWESCGSAPARGHAVRLPTATVAGRSVSSPIR